LRSGVRADPLAREMRKGQNIMAATSARSTSLSASTTTPQPVRLQAPFRSAQALVTEYAKSVTRGGCVVVAKRPVIVGSRFVFEMSIPGQVKPLELEGQVTHVTPFDDDHGNPRFEIGIAYERTREQHEVLERLLAQIEIDPSFDIRRTHPRIPVNLLALDRDRGDEIMIHDLSLGGMQLESAAFPSGVGPGARLALTVTLAGRTIDIPGTVVWLRSQASSAGAAALGGTRLGVKFDELDGLRTVAVDGMLHLARPDRLEIGFARRPAIDARRVLDDAARSYFGRMGDLSLVPYADPIHLLEPDITTARVALSGDITAELSLEASAMLGAHLATHMLGERVPAANREVIADALAEILTGLAGHAADLVEHAAIVDVSAPLPGALERRPGDQVQVLTYNAALGLMRLTIVLRHRNLARGTLTGK
jgi:Tfp pilus assembly protein PilZ